MKDNKNKIDLSWGHTPLISEEFLSVFKLNLKYSQGDFNYLPYNGLENFIESIKDFYFNVFNINLKKHNIIITEGASRAINLLGETWKHKKIDTVITRPHFYSKMPTLITNSGLTPLKVRFFVEQEKSNLAFFYEIPSNPIGLIKLPEISNNAALDLAYFSKTYINDHSEINKISKKVNKFNYLIFSFGKLSGLNSMRLGVLGLADNNDFEFAKKIMGETTLGASVFSQKIFNDLIQEKQYNNWNLFFKKSADKLNHNRNLVYRASKKIDVEVLSTDNGMFSVWKMPTDLYKIIEKKFVFTQGNLFGFASTNEKEIVVRINLARTLEEISFFSEFIKKL